MLTTNYAKNNLVAYNPLLKYYLQKYNGLLTPYNFYTVDYKKNSENKCRKVQFIEYEKNANYSSDDEIEHSYACNNYLCNTDSYNNPHNNPLNANLFFILGSAMIGYSFYHFFYKKK